MNEHPEIKEFVDKLVVLSKEYNIWLDVTGGRNRLGKRVFDTRNCNTDSWNSRRYETRVPMEDDIDRTSAFIFSEDE